ncbi:MAG: thiamine-phosphate kinase [Synechococcales cyanobacterium]
MGWRVLGGYRRYCKLKAFGNRALVTELTVADLGEAGVLSRLAPYCLAGRIGDDAATVPPTQGSLLVSTDVLVEGVHFSEATTPAYAVGWRAAAANLSDLAAMGCWQPLGLLVGLGIPGQTAMAWLEDLYRGLRDCCALWQTGVIGGDVCRAGQRLVAITVLGQGEPLLVRHGAQVGDWLVVTGPHGLSRAGLELLLSRDPDPDPVLIQAHQYPRPRLDVARALSQLGIPTCGGMDSSDGLADALIQLMQASGVSAHLETLPLHPALQQRFPAQAEAWTLYGGEDFELVLSLPPLQAQRLIERVPGVQHLGTVTAGSPGEVWWGSTRLERRAAFQHFA